MRIKGLLDSRACFILEAMNLILLQKSEVDEAGRAVLADERARHMRKILKAEAGRRVRIGLLNGPLGEGTVESVQRGEVILRCVFEESVPPRPSVDLVLAMPRPKVMKRLWPQLAALGVDRIVLIRAAKVERYYFDSHVLEPEFYEKLLIEGLQQARCTQLPEVRVEPLFKPFVEDEMEGLFAGSLKLLADPSGEKLLDEIIPKETPPERAVLAIGPEGGWTPFELDKLQAGGFNLFGMGKRILRTDTATVALLAQLAGLVRGD